MFSNNSFRYWDKDFADIQELINSVGSNGEFYGACDPSLGRKHPQDDFTAIITLLKDTRSKIIYVIGADLARRKPNDILTRIANLARMYRYRSFVVETNQFQELLADQLKQKIRQEGLNLSIKKVNNTSNKQTRIESIEPLITQGTLRFCRRHTTLLEQLKQFPFGAHDDGPDALEMAASVARIEHYTVSYQV